MRGWYLRTLGAVLVLVWLAGCGGGGGGTSSSDPPTWPSLRDLGRDGYIYGLPIVMAYQAMYEYAVDRDSGQFQAPFNVLAHSHHVFTWQDTVIVTPNSDTPYSTVWMDLRAEPLVLTVPAVDPARYYSVQLCDSNTYNYGYVGSRTTGNGPGHYLVAGPEWDGGLPPGIERAFRSSTWFSTAVFRTQLFNPEDMPNVEAVQAGYRVQPLSAFLGQPAPPQPPTPDFPAIDDSLFADRFFDYLDFMLQFAPAEPEEWPARAELAMLGVGPTKAFDYDSLSPGQKAEVQQGMQEGDAIIHQYLAGGVVNLNRWILGSFFGDRAFCGGDWLKRAAGASAGLFGNDVAEAAYPATRAAVTGEPLDGSQHRYTLTFARDQLPPAQAFWSVTMYDGTTQLLVHNEIDRYLINTPMLPDLQFDPVDGSLTIYLQRDNPGPDRVSNWLPAPDGPIYVVMRLYWPRTEPPTLLPLGSGTWAPPGVQIAD